jgi:hypothetical protein
MGQVFVHGPGLALGRGDGDALLGRIVEQVVAAGESVVEFGDAPRGDDLDRGLEGVEGQLEADLVISFLKKAKSQYIDTKPCGRCGLGPKL